MAEGRNELSQVYNDLLRYYGSQSWWPADDQFEVMVGAILTQNTAWTNVEKAIQNLKQHDLCEAEPLANIDLDRLAGLIRPSGYFNQKAKRLKGFAAWYQQQGGYEALQQQGDAQLRDNLLALHGIGEETADDMVLYAFDRPSFVIDAYTRRLLSRLGLASGKEKYAELQALFHDNLIEDVEVFKLYHALIVSHAKRHCMKKPDCDGCPLQSKCCYCHE